MTVQYFLVLAIIFSGMLIMTAASAVGQGAKVMLPGSSQAPPVLDPTKCLTVFLGRSILMSSGSWLTNISSEQNK